MLFVSDTPFRGEVSDDQLVTLARAQNEEAFARLVSRYSGVLHRLSAQYGSASSPEAEDLAQEGLLGLLSAVQTYRAGGTATFGTYAYTCMRNRMLSAVRRSQGTPPVQLLSDEPVPSGTGDGPEALLVRLEELESLRTHLRSVLSELEYQVLMRYLGAYSYEEIAADLSVGKKTVDNALRRTRRKLAISPFPTRL